MLKPISLGVAALMMVFVGLAVAAQLSATPPAIPPSPFSVGTQYVVIWDCIPDWMPVAGQAMLRTPNGLNPCYAELLTVRRLRTDGWVEVTTENEPNGPPWIINPAQVAQLQPQIRGRQAVR